MDIEIASLVAQIQSARQKKKQMVREMAIMEHNIRYFHIKEQQIAVIEDVCREENGKFLRLDRKKKQRCAHRQAGRHTVQD